MADLTFLQNSRIGRNYYRLKPDCIEISLLWWRGGDRRFLLRSISLDYSRGAHRFHYLYIIPGIVAALALSFITLVLSQDVMPHTIIIHASFFLIGGVVGVIRGVPRVEYFQFYDHWRRPMFYIVREGANAEECDDFVREFLDRVERAHNEETHVEMAASPLAPVSAVHLPSAHDAYFSGEIKWQFAIVFGVLAAGLPLVPRLDASLAGLLFMIVFGCTLGGLVMAVLSYQAKERWRHLSLVGAVLSLIPPFFY